MAILHTCLWTSRTYGGFWRKKEFYKSESLGKNEVAESSPNDVSYEGSSDSKWSGHCLALLKVCQQLLDHRPHVPRSATSSSGLVHDFGEFRQNSVCSWQKNHCCFGSDRQWECALGSGESVFREQRQRWLCESGQDWVWCYARMRILKEKESYRGKSGP